MSASRPTLSATQRQVTGKHVARLRRAGQLPAVVYGRGLESSALTLEAHDFEMLQRRVGPNALIDLTIDGKKPSPVLVHGVQRDPVHRRMLHVDLFAVRMTEELTVDVPLAFVGESYAIDKLGGTLLHVAEHIKVRALPDHLPQSIEVRIDGLDDFETSVRVRDLTIPGDVTLLTDADEIVARVQAPRVEEEVPVAVEEEVEAEAEAEGAPAGAAAGEGTQTTGESPEG